MIAIPCMGGGTYYSITPVKGGSLALGESFVFQSMILTSKPLRLTVGFPAPFPNHSYTKILKTAVKGSFQQF